MVCTSSMRRYSEYAPIGMRATSAYGACPSMRRCQIYARNACRQSAAVPATSVVSDGAQWLSLQTERPTRPVSFLVSDEALETSPREIHPSRAFINVFVFSSALRAVRLIGCERRRAHELDLCRLCHLCHRACRGHEHLRRPAPPLQADLALAGGQDPTEAGCPEETDGACTFHPSASTPHTGMCRTGRSLPATQARPRSPRRAAGW